LGVCGGDKRTELLLFLQHYINSVAILLFIGNSMLFLKYSFKS